jgi:hypothetical protein
VSVSRQQTRTHELEIRPFLDKAAAFYRRLGYVEDAIRSTGKRLIEDGGT